MHTPSLAEQILDRPDAILQLHTLQNALEDEKKRPTVEKKDDYAAHGVQEYWIVDPFKQRIEQYILTSGSSVYFTAKVHQYGEIFESEAIPGFSIPVKAVFEEAANMEALQALME